MAEEALQMEDCTLGVLMPLAIFLVGLFWQMQQKHLWNSAVLTGINGE